MRLTPETMVGVVVVPAGLVAMYSDHLAHGADDWAAFSGSAALVVTLAALVFVRIVPRARADPDRAGRQSLVCGSLAVLSVALIWLGVPWVVGGGAVALGLIGRRGGHPRLATAGAALGALVLALCVIGSDWSSDG